MLNAQANEAELVLTDENEDLVSRVAQQHGNGQCLSESIRNTSMAVKTAAIRRATTHENDHGESRSDVRRSRHPHVHEAIVLASHHVPTPENKRSQVNQLSPVMNPAPLINHPRVHHYVLSIKVRRDERRPPNGSIVTGRSR